MTLAEQNNLKLNLSCLNTDRIDKTERYAVCEILHTIKKTGEEITLVALGPLTNIALAIIIDPQTMSEVEKIIMMGGNLKTEKSAIDDRNER